MKAWGSAFHRPVLTRLGGKSVDTKQDTVLALRPCAYCNKNRAVFAGPRSFARRRNRNSFCIALKMFSPQTFALLALTGLVRSTFRRP